MENILIQKYRKSENMSYIQRNSKALIRLIQIGSIFSSHIFKISLKSESVISDTAINDQNLQYSF